VGDVVAKTFVDTLASTLAEAENKKVSDTLGYVESEVRGKQTDFAT